MRLVAKNRTLRKWSYVDGMVAEEKGNNILPLSLKLGTSNFQFVLGLNDHECRTVEHFIGLLRREGMIGTRLSLETGFPIHSRHKQAPSASEEKKAG